MKIKPITPNEANEIKLKSDLDVPDFVIEAFNDLIGKNYDGDISYFLQKEVVTAINKLTKLMKPRPKFDVKWLNVEAVFEKAGWHIAYDSGCRMDDEESYTFTKEK